MKNIENNIIPWINEYPWPAFVIFPERSSILGNKLLEELLGDQDHGNIQISSLTQREEFEPLSKLIQQTNLSKTDTLPVTYHEQNCLQWLVYESNNALICLSQPVNAFIQAIEHAKKLQTSIIDLLPSHYILWKNIDSVYLGCNKALADALGLPSTNAIIGKTDFDLPTTREQSELYRADDREVMRTGSPKLNIEETQTLPGQGNRTLLTSKVPLLNEQGIATGVLAIYSDITEQKVLQHSLEVSKEKAEAANNAKTEFLENMRHDIRTPLTGIVGFAEILKIESQEPRIKEYAENIVASSQALLHLMDEVLEAIRVSSGEIPKLRKKFELKKILEHILNLNRSKAAQKRLDITFDFDSAIPQYLVGDKIRIHRVGLELMANALNFTDQGFVKISAKLAKQENRESIIKLIVEDSGVGIPKEKQQEIYLQFRRLTPSYQGIYKGAGLGLSVIKQFIDELNGEIYVSSEPGKGSQFTCIIPLQKALLDDDEGIDTDLERLFDATYESTYAQQFSPALLTNENTEDFTHRILVVEDTLIAQRVAQSLLGQFQCQTDIADCGKKAVEMANSNDYDLIFMDIGLPDMDGYEVTHRIRVQELTKKNHVPIIALTAHAGDENKKRCIEAGMNAVLSKPLTLQNCSDIIESFIPGQRKEKSEISKNNGLPEEVSHLFELSQFPLLNLEEGINTLGDKAVLFDMLKLMINGELTKDLAMMKEAHDNNDWDKIQQVAHKIKGGSVYVGAIRMGIACQYLERYWKTGQRDLLEQLYQQLIAVIDDSIKSIQGSLNK
ncbi:Aerobic respiration control sensor protein ArcB [Legionella massiliensis]|uniref:histidine kinase n=1 Tax=Legionella massiliensis TaxID=1034943 RepID=A0A078KY96_9GAMM|nr:response regulator [Legionella massiliensis]CDZ78022.1 Aerobic respiration control sensor protein ArcB [Legionella massiliensis]CEE13760.1 Aerobic respiration control sensor protein ArcB [Legionella massiliensis]